MKIGEQAVDDLEPEAGQDEQPGLAAAGGEHAVAHARFERAHAGRADCDHPPAGRAGLVDEARRLVRDRVALAVHPVLLQPFDAHRLERAGADVQGDEGDAHAARLQRREQVLAQVQARGGCRHRAGRARVDGLVARGVLGLRRVVDVGRQRNVAGRLEHGVQRIVEREFEKIVLAPDHGGRKRPAPARPGRFAVKAQRRARTRRMAGAQQDQRTPRRERALDQDFHPPAGGLLAVQPRLDDARVVEYEHVARIEGREQVRNAPVAQRVARPQVQQARAVAPGRGMLRDQLGRQFEFELVAPQRVGAGRRGGWRLAGGAGGSVDGWTGHGVLGDS